MTLDQYDDLPAVLQQQIDLLLGARMKRRKVERDRQQQQVEHATRRTVR